MKTIALLTICLSLVGCAGTKVSENGKEVFRTQMNAKRVVYRSPAGSYLEVEGMNHSTPTRAGGSVLGTATAGAAGIITAIATRGIVR